VLISRACLDGPPSATRAGRLIWGGASRPRPQMNADSHPKIEQNIVGRRELETILAVRLALGPGGCGLRDAGGFEMSRKIQPVESCPSELQGWRR
jgi:hypothetical protein